jgi:hypothetical protein
MRSSPCAPFFSEGPSVRKSFRKTSNEIENGDLHLPPLRRRGVLWFFEAHEATASKGGVS